MVCNCFSQQTAQVFWIVTENLLEFHETEVKNHDSECLCETKASCLHVIVLRYDDGSWFWNLSLFFPHSYGLSASLKKSFLLMIRRVNSLIVIRSLLHMVIRIKNVSRNQKCRHSVPFLHQFSSKHKTSFRRVVHIEVIDEISFGKVKNINRK